MVINWDDPPSMFLLVGVARSSQSRKRPVGAGHAWAGILEDGLEVQVDDGGVRRRWWKQEPVEGVFP